MPREVRYEFIDEQLVRQELVNSRQRRHHTSPFAAFNQTGRTKNESVLFESKYYKGEFLSHLVSRIQLKVSCFRLSGVLKVVNCKLPLSYETKGWLFIIIVLIVYFNFFSQMIEFLGEFVIDEDSTVAETKKELLQDLRIVQNIDIPFERFV